MSPTTTIRTNNIRLPIAFPYLKLMKKLILSAFVAMSASAMAYVVDNGAQAGYEVTAGKALYISTPEGKAFQLTADPFITETQTMAPTSPVLCSWSPDGKYVAVFMQNNRVTYIYVFDLKDHTLLNQNDGNPKYPEWYDGNGTVAVTTSVPGAWSGNSLSVDTMVQWRSSEVPKRVMKELLTITDGSTFALRPVLEGL